MITRRLLNTTLHCALRTAHDSKAHNSQPTTTAVRIVASVFVTLLNRFCRAQPNGPTVVIGGRRLGGGAAGAT